MVLKNYFLSGKIWQENLGERLAQFSAKRKRTFQKWSRDKSDKIEHAEILKTLTNKIDTFGSNQLETKNTDIFYILYSSLKRLLLLIGILCILPFVLLMCSVLPLTSYVLYYIFHIYAIFLVFLYFDEMSQLILFESVM